MGEISQDVTLALYTTVAAWTLLLLMSKPGRHQVGSIFYKMRLSLTVLAHILFSRDRKWKKKDIVDSDAIKGVPPAGKKRIMFIRHGESDWNEVFNRGFGPLFPVRLVVGIVREFFMWPSQDSLFVDSPLSKLGFKQTRSLQAFLERSNFDDPKVAEAVQVLKGLKGSSLLVSSNLRRAIATAVIGLWGRVSRTNEKFKILSCGQEISRNPDTIALAPAKGVPDLNQSLGKELTSLGFAYDPAALFDASLNTGSKRRSGTGLERMQTFAQWVFTQKEDTIILTGHSLWFKHFFNIYLPSASDHPARSKKMTNCGVVSFELATAPCDGKQMYRIDPDSITVVYGKIG